LASEKQITEYKSVFEMFDEEGNGTVKTQELERLMTSGNISLITCFCVITGKGTFNRESFLALMALIHESTRGQHAVLRAAFKVFEKEAEGYIEWNTLKYVLMNVGEPLNELEAEQMMEADKDGDGSFDYEEFVNMMTGGSVKMS
uniref:Calmodulin like 6 n=1 Tax=Oncorhynchus kisutch TaxID=8019 RepID=A0A8C7IK68_ONCKI